MFPILKCFMDTQQKYYFSFNKSKDYTIEQFYSEEESNLCLNDTFSTSRISASMIFNTHNKFQEVILSGGLNSQMKTKLLLHKYVKSEKEWKDIASEEFGKPKFNIFQHTSIQHKSIIYFVGGIAVIPSV